MAVELDQRFVAVVKILRILPAFDGFVGLIVVVKY